MGRMETAITALVVIVWVGLVLVGPPALLFWLIRRRKRRERALRDSAIAAAAAPPLSLEPASNISIDAASSPAEPAKPEGPSACYPQTFIIFLVLGIVGVNGKDSWWGIIPQLLALGILFAGARDSLSQESFEHVLKNYPTETREHYRVNSLFSLVVVPGLVWVFLGLPSLLWWITQYLFAVSKAAAIS